MFYPPPNAICAGRPTSNKNVSEFLCYDLVFIMTKIALSRRRGRTCLHRNQNPATW